MLFTRISTGPNRSSTAVMCSSIAEISARSQARTNTDFRLGSMRSAVAEAASWLRAATTTRAPSAASSAAIAPPSPPPAPRTSAVRPLIPRVHDSFWWVHFGMSLIGPADWDRSYVGFGAAAAMGFVKVISSLSSHCTVSPGSMGTAPGVPVDRMSPG